VVSGTTSLIEFFHCDFLFPAILEFRLLCYFHRHLFPSNSEYFAICLDVSALQPLMPWSSSIINNASINPFVGHPGLVDYTSTKGVGISSPFASHSLTRFSTQAIVGFTRALSNQIVKTKGIRVNAICPGPILTPLVVATMSKESMESFGVTSKFNPSIVDRPYADPLAASIGRPGQPVECATCCVFLASYDSTYVTAQMM
jgi:NAD(P)-dependent dehydrogenase (short-subunit alcohol dehydrogenase family)